MAEKWYYLFQIVYDDENHSNTFTTTYKSSTKFDLSKFEIKLLDNTETYNIDDQCTKNNYYETCVNIKDNNLSNSTITDKRYSGAKNKYEIFICVLDNGNKNTIEEILVRSLDNKDSLVTLINEYGDSLDNRGRKNKFDIQNLCLKSIIKKISLLH